MRMLTASAIQAAALSRSRRMSVSEVIACVERLEVATRCLLVAVHAWPWNQQEERWATYRVNHAVAHATAAAHEARKLLRLTGALGEE